MIAELPVPFQSSYAASKLALWAYVQSLRHELQTHRIRTTLVQPGYFRTGIADKRPWTAPAQLRLTRRVDDRQGQRRPRAPPRP